MVRRTAQLIAIAALGTHAACLFDLGRADELAPGDVAGRALLAGEPAESVRVDVIGDGRVRATDADGAFLFSDVAPGSWALRVSSDRDGDGFWDAAITRAVTVHVARHAAGLVGQSEPAPTWVQLGDLLLAGVVELNGRVLSGVNGQPIAGAHVYAYRSLDLPAATLTAEGDARGVLTSTLPVEAVATTDDTGAWRLPGIAAGALSLLAIASPDDAPALISEVLNQSAIEGLTVDVPTLVVAPAAGARAVQLHLAALPGGRVKVVVVPAGVPVASQTLADFATGTVLNGRLDLTLSLTPGVYDVHVASEAGARGALYRQAIAGGEGAIALGPVRLALTPPCEGAGVLDCDGDGVRSLPYSLVDGVPVPEDLSTWTRCGGQCGTAFGTLGASTCVVDGAEFDCDDDLDGQPDVTEPPGCLGLAGGRDSDGDGLCDNEDPFPRCRDNDPAADACAYDAEADPFDGPRVRPEYGGPAAP